MHDLTLDLPPLRMRLKQARGLRADSGELLRRVTKNRNNNVKRNELVLPSYIGMRNLEALFKFCAEVANTNGDIDIDASKVNFIDPMGLTVLTALLGPVCAARTVHLSWLSVNIASYLDRMDFFTHCPVKGVELSASVTRNDLTRSLVEVTSVTDAHETDSTAIRLATALTGSMTGLHRLPVKFNDGQDPFEKFSHPIKYALTELLDNALTHARREGRFEAAVWVAAQYYNNGLVRIGVADNGCGFLTTLFSHQRLARKTHQAAIELALEPFVSCNRDMGRFVESENQGVGLTTTRRISEFAGGGMTIVSGNAKFATGSGGAEFKSGAFWPGVAISFVCKRDLLPLTNPSALLPELPMAAHPVPNLRFAD